ncbi:Pkinase-domain-containing protein [Pholiota conissans]|uniref:Serine/threonine-protein kinase n=1 Tax=Pholiota conissans TaxID=109636 RepID=A0A9P5Z190_9AGAR|nr:Pkinase-domain-containing protein [Pholiota conissans]
MYQQQTYTRMPAAAQQVPIIRRHPLTNTVNHQVNHQPNQQQTPPKPPPKAPSSPPLPRQNSKTAPPSPPKVITDKSGRLQFSRVGFLGEGGFARVYEVKDVRGYRLACKVVTKSSLKTKKAKTKLYAEIKIHRSLEHPNIVNFQECFEDEDNVYMTLELCPSGSLMDMLRRRRRFTEPESRFFMVQLIGACHYMHTHQVIHRDLKLGNLFLDANMNVKVGDFGLAALIENPGERKKTICGTPNYIAPEVLFDTANGHSFEVDTWSIGVILYTLVIGRPPFQTKDVKAIYKRIRDNEYEFPTERVISSAVQNLIQQILTPDPSQRPSLHEIVDHAFFTQGPVPPYIPTSAHDSAPDFRHISKSASDANLKRLRKYSLLDADPATLGASGVSQSTSAGNGNALAASKSIAGSIAQQEKEFQKAVQPGSPISALLSSARQPLLMGTATSPGGGGAPRENPLLRKLQAVKESPLGRRSVTRGLDGIVEEERNYGSLQSRRKAPPSSDDGDHEEEEMRLRKKELEAQKARIVAQMAPVREEAEPEYDMEEPPAPVAKPTEKAREAYVAQGRENAAPRAGATAITNKYASRMRPQPKLDEKENPRAAAHAAPAPEPAPTPAVKLNGFDAAAHTLTLAFDAKAAGRVFRTPVDMLPLPEERVFIVSWVDYCNKYGMGYALTDGSVGVHFNDSTTLVLSPDKVHFDYITSRRSGSVYVRKAYTVDVYPEELKSKVYLLKHFERYIMDRLYGEYTYTFEDVGREKGMEWVQKYLRMKHVIVFKLSHDVLQFNFYDHSKLILSSQGLLVTHIDKHYNMTRWTLSDIMAQAMRPPALNADPEQVKFQQRLVDKLKYCKEVLVSIRTASAAGGTGIPEENDAMGSALTGGMGSAPAAETNPGRPAATGTLTSKASRMALR